MRRMSEDLRGLRTSIHDLRNTLQPLFLASDRHEAAIEALGDGAKLRDEHDRDRWPAAATWLGVLSAALLALGTLGLWWSTAHAQPDPQSIAQAVVQAMDARGRR